MKRVAIIEDNPDNRLLLRVLLEERYVVDEFADGGTALTAFAAQRPDLVLLDISLPVKDGIEVLRELRTTPALAAVPVIALTAYAMAGDRERFLAAGFNDYLAKPILDEQDLYNLIERWLNH